MCGTRLIRMEFVPNAIGTGLLPRACGASSSRRTRSGTTSRVGILKRARKRRGSLKRDSPPRIRTATLQRWQAACETTGFLGLTRDYLRVMRGWSSWGRHYHTVAHLEACLKELDTSREFASAPGEVELSLWFHDAIYSTWRGDNEARSAALAAKLMERKAPPGLVERITSAVLATRHQDTELTGDPALVVDIDLAILGKSPEIYQEFERNVRREYWWVPHRRYVSERCAVLESFLERKSIYCSREFRARYEATARQNLMSAMEGLRSSHR